jgi:hypothetical protein
VTQQMVPPGTLTEQQIRRLWTLHGLPDHIGGAELEVDPGGRVLGWEAVCSCGWRCGAYVMIDADSADSVLAKLVETMGDWLGHFTIHMTSDAAFDELFDGPVCVSGQTRDANMMTVELSPVVTRPGYVAAVAWSG